MGRGRGIERGGKRPKIKNGVIAPEKSGGLAFGWMGGWVDGWRASGAHLLECGYCIIVLADTVAPRIPLILHKTSGPGILV